MLGFVYFHYFINIILILFQKLQVENKKSSIREFKVFGIC